MQEPMTSLERCLATVNYRPHDCVPVNLQNFMMTVVEAKVSPDRLYTNGKLLGEAQLEAWKRFGHDMLLIENGTAALAEACGCEVSYPPDSAPRIEKPLLKSLAEVSRLSQPDPLKSGLCGAVLGGYTAGPG